MMQGRMFQVFDLGPSLNFVTKKREDLAVFVIKQILHFLKHKLRHK